MLCYTLIKAVMTIFHKRTEKPQHLGSPSHMTHDGDQLASYSFSLTALSGSSRPWAASSTTCTSSAFRATVGDVALAFKPGAAWPGCWLSPGFWHMGVRRQP